MALTIQGYQIAKKDIPNILTIRGKLTVKPYVPSVFVKPQYVQRYPVFVEDSDYMYVPKHFGISEFGVPKTSLRTVNPSNEANWEFNGTIRKEQEEVINSFMCPTPRDGIISLQTGGGKTVCALKIASLLKVPCIVLVHNTFLRDQWVERITSFLPKARIGTVQGDTITIEDKEIVVAMLQSVSMKKYSTNTFAKFGFVIVDECHHIASESFSKAIPKLTSQYMLGLSATPERKDKLMHVINWFLGPLLYTSSTSDKVDEHVQVEVYEFEPPDSSFNEIIYNQSGVMFTSLMINKVVDYLPRNKLLIELLEDVLEDPVRQMLVLTDRVEHAKTLFNLLKLEDQEKACILARNVKSEQRAEWFETKRAFIATYSMCKEGFDLSKLNTLLIASPRPDIDQIVGRILRTDKAKRTINPLIIDVVDPAFRRQFQQRNSLYKSRSYTVTKMELNTIQ